METLNHLGCVAGGSEGTTLMQGAQMKTAACQEPFHNKSLPYCAPGAAIECTDEFGALSRRQGERNPWGGEHAHCTAPDYSALELLQCLISMAITNIIFVTTLKLGFCPLCSSGSKD